MEERKKKNDSFAVTRMAWKFGPCKQNVARLMHIKMKIKLAYLAAS